MGEKFFPNRKQYHYFFQFKRRLLHNVSASKYIVIYIRQNIFLQWRGFQKSCAYLAGLLNALIKERKKN